MRESILHYIWKYQKFDHQDLLTTDGRSVRVIANGHHNQNAGPDFSEAKIKIEDLLWAGPVEIHVRSSDWRRHGHPSDQAYQNVVLHVVWQHDEEVILDDGSHLPTLALQARVDDSFIQKSLSLLNSPDDVPCSSQLSNVKSIHIGAMTEQSLVHRLEQKSSLVLQSLAKNKGSWEETVFQLLARNFGFKVNAEAFEKLAKSVTHKVCLKHVDQPLQLEALLYGIAGFLPAEPKDEYTSIMTREYQYLAKKYHLSDKEMLRVAWKFLRMRPGNFPTVRIAQLAAFLTKNDKFFNKLIHFSDIKELKKMFDVQPSDYWVNNYDFGKEAKRRHGSIGLASIEVLLINTVAPVLAAYSQRSNNSLYMEKAIDLLEALKPEKNKITEGWLQRGLSIKSAAQSQGLITLYNDFCLKKKCLSCKIGGNLLSH